jgi:hypothetical protein
LSDAVVCDVGIKCQGRCPPGHICPAEGTLVPIPCGENTVLVDSRGRFAYQCLPCADGDWCQKGPLIVITKRLNIEK